MSAVCQMIGCEGIRNGRTKGPYGVILFADCWDIQWRRRQQIAYRLAQSDLIKHVLYVENPLNVTSFLKFLAGRADLDGMDRWRRVLDNHSWLMPISNKLTVLTTFALLPTVGYAPLFRLSERFRRDWFLRKIKPLKISLGLDHPIVWVSFPGVPLDIVQALRPDLLWYDCTEDFSAEPAFPPCLRDQIVEVDRYLTNSAGVVTAVSRILVEEKLAFNPNTHWLPNAVDTLLFSQAGGAHDVPAELLMAKRPVIAFVGGMDELSHDWGLLDAIATMRPEWTILLVGSQDVSFATSRMLQRHPGVISVGRKPYEKLPAYLTHSDVCFLFYRPVRRNTTRNSQKLFLYLASGKPVVSTSAADVESYSDYVYVADTPQAFVSAVEKALCEHSAARAQAYREVALRNSWETRIGEITQILTRAMARDGR